jgi:hypothetical protein
MKVLTITKDNYMEFWDTRPAYYPYNNKLQLKDFQQKQIKKLCSIMPEFTHNPCLRLVPMTEKEKQCFAGDGFVKFLVYESDYFYTIEGKCVVRLCDTWFGFDGNKFGDAEVIKIDIASFGIKQASEAKMKQLRGFSSY